jgi:hypothetical protein
MIVITRKLFSALHVATMMMFLVGCANKNDAIMALAK